MNNAQSHAYIHTHCEPSWLGAPAASAAMPSGRPRRLGAWHGPPAPLGLIPLRARICFSCRVWKIRAQRQLTGSH